MVGNGSAEAEARDTDRSGMVENVANTSIEGNIFQIHVKISKHLLYIFRSLFDSLQQKMIENLSICAYLNI